MATKTANYYLIMPDVTDKIKVSDLNYDFNELDKKLFEVESVAQNANSLASEAKSLAQNNLASIPTASTASIGGIKLGSDFSITSDGKLLLSDAAIEKLQSVQLVIW